MLSPRLTYWLSLGVPFVVSAAAVAGQVPTDSGAHRFHVDASALRAGELVYQLAIERDSSTVQLGERVVTISETSYAGAPAWLLVDIRTGDGVAAADSLIAGRADLRPLHWASTQNAAHLGVEFAGDSLFGAVTAPQGRRSIVYAVPPGALVNAAALETALRLIPLQAGWRDSTTSLSLTVAANATIATQLAVTGEETVRVPAGSFACWVVSATAENAHATFWVSKGDAVVVRSAHNLGPNANARLVTTLARAGP